MLDQVLNLIWIQLLDFKLRGEDSHPFNFASNYATKHYFLGICKEIILA